MERRSLRPKILKQSAVIFNKNLFSREDDLKIDGMLDEPTFNNMSLPTFELNIDIDSLSFSKMMYEDEFKKRGNQYDRGAGFKNRSLSQLED